MIDLTPYQKNMLMSIIAELNKMLYTGEIQVAHGQSCNKWVTVVTYYADPPSHRSDLTRDCVMNETVLCEISDSDSIRSFYNARLRAIHLIRHGNLSRINYGHPLFPCKTCEKLTNASIGCPACWEVEHRLEDYLKNGPKAVQFVKNTLEKVIGVELVEEVGK